MADHANIAQLTIAIFGEILADIFPNETILGGAPYNVARHLRAFQQHPILISRVGNDALKNKLFSELIQHDIDQSGIQLDAHYPTGQVKVHIEHGAHRFEIKPDQAYDHIHPGITHLTTLAAQPKVAYFGTLAQRSTQSRLALDNFLSDAKCPRFLDVNLRAPWYNKHMIRRSLFRADIVKMNEEELRIICELFEPSGHTDQDLALFLMKKFNLKHLFITYGKDGAWALSHDGETVKVTGQTLTTPLIDTVGAGDAFSAICILGLLRDWSLHTILTRASIFAATICTIRGATPKTSDFYSPHIENWL